MLCDTGQLDHGSAVGSDEEKERRKSRMGRNYKTQSVHIHAVLQTQSFPSCFRFGSICVLQGEQKVLLFDSSANELQIKQYCLTLVRVSSSCSSVMMTVCRCSAWPARRLGTRNGHGGRREVLGSSQGIKMHQKARKGITKPQPGSLGLS